MATEKELLKRLKDARADRDRHASRLNKFYDLALPYRVRIGSSTQAYMPDTDGQSDLFDRELQICVADFASDQADYFCPDYKPWVKSKPGIELSTGQERQLNDQLESWEGRLYDLIRGTDFYEQVYEVFADLAGGAAGINIAFQPVSRPVRCQPVLMTNLLFDEGPFSDLDGRWNEFWTMKGMLPIIFPGVDLTKAQIAQKRDDEKIRVVQGCRREWKPEGAPEWFWAIFINNKLVHDKPLMTNEPPPLNVARWRHSPPSAWGPGPADLGMAAAETLDELALLNLKKLGKEADPPFSYENDGVFNPEGGIDPGVWVGRRPGSAPPTPLFEPSNSQNLYFDRETLRMIVRRALYQDGPYQRGETPPTATQWMDEKAVQQRRLQARRRVYREFVLPCLQRFSWVFAQRGELDMVKIDGKEVAVEFVSPLSKASDAEEVSSAIQFAQASIGIFGETALAAVDVKATMDKWQEKLGDRTVSIISPDSQEALVQKILTEGRNLVNNGA